ncbi:MAG: DUF2147 domain-containing protein [Sphingopyxis sp.]
MAIAMAGAALPSAAGSQSATDIAGRWLTNDGKAIITIAPCGNGPAHCGRITRLTGAQPAGGARDGNNPDAALRTRPVIGITVLSNLNRSGTQWTGRGYSPEEGRNFTATVSATGGNGLRVRGCVSVFCRTLDWTRTN